MSTKVVASIWKESLLRGKDDRKEWFTHVFSPSRQSGFTRKVDQYKERFHGFPLGIPLQAPKRVGQVNKRTHIFLAKSIFTEEIPVRWTLK